MRFLQEPSNGIFLAAKEGLDEASVKRLISVSDMCISDFDDTDVRSPAKLIAYDHLKSPRALDPRFLTWCAAAGYNLFKDGKRAESKTWKEYVRKFLESPESRKSAAELVKNNAENILFPGVADFYKEIDAIFKFYITRNIKEIVDPFALRFKFDGVFAEAADKEKAIHELLKARPEVKRIFLKGDSEEDLGALEVLDFYKRAGRLEEVIGCFVADSPETLDTRFDISIGRDYRGLVGLIRGS